MSVYSAKTGISSILKSYSSAERDNVKKAIINNVRYDVQKKVSLLDVVSAVSERYYTKPMIEYIDYLQNSTIDDKQFIIIFQDAHSIVHMLSPKFSSLVEALLNISWNNRTTEAIQIYITFFTDLMIAQSKYIIYGIGTLISLLIPAENDELQWPNGVPDEKIKSKIKPIHCLLERLLDLIPMTIDTILDAIDKSFPYYKKPTYIITGFIYNVLWMLEYKPNMRDYILVLLLQKLIKLDVNAPRAEIEESDYNDADDMSEDENDIFNMEEVKGTNNMEMSHSVAQTLDLCMNIMYEYFDTKCGLKNVYDKNQALPLTKEGELLFNDLLDAFNTVILPSHNTHHVQFLMFYFCSLKHTYAEFFLNALWHNIKDLNAPTVVKQSSVGYLASFLARAKVLPLPLIQFYLKQLCDWAHQYIQRSDRANITLKSHIIFYTVCQAIFYVIAFRSRALTADKKDLVFLQALQLSGLVTSNFNPLRVCLPAVATAFAGVTRTYQLAYCHAILERNARRKLATVYKNDVETPEETLDTFFPFDPYLLKSSGKRIEPIYLQYQHSETEEQTTTVTNILVERTTRKRGDSEMLDDCDVDDFIYQEKRSKCVDIPKHKQEIGAQFTYGLSPGFQ